MSLTPSTSLKPEPVSRFGRVASLSAFGRDRRLRRLKRLRRIGCEASPPSAVVSLDAVSVFEARACQPLRPSSVRACRPSAEVSAFGVLKRLRRIGCEASQPSAVVSLGLRPWSAPFLSVSPRDLEPAGSSQIEPKHSWRGWGWINAAIFLLLLEFEF